MKLRLTYLLFYLLCNLSNFGQINLVPNPSFEDNYGCFYGLNLINDTINGNNRMKNWFTGVNMTPECFDVCTNTFQGPNYPGSSAIPLNCVGYQYPRTGNAYCGAVLYGLIYPDSVKNNTEVPIVRLKNKLTQNHCYYGEFFYSLTDRSNLIVNRLGLYVNQSVISYTIPLTYDNSIIPQIEIDTTQFISADTTNWIKVAGNFIAQGGEEFLHIGNFRDGKHVKYQFVNSSFIPTCMTDNDLCYIYIDDVSLYELPLPNIQNTSITICPNADTLILGDTTRIHSRYQWYANGTAIDTTSFIKVKPTQTTTYVLQTTQCSITTQSIVVTYSANCEPVVVVEPLIPNAFTPNNDSINDVWRFSLGKGNTLKALSIYNRWGNDITPSFYQQEHIKATTVLWDGRTTAGEQSPSGVYFYMLHYTDANGDEHKKNGYITLFK